MGVSPKKRRSRSIKEAFASLKIAMPYHLERFKRAISNYVEIFKSYKKRYNLDFCLLFLYADNDLTSYAKDLGKIFRKIDQQVIIDEHNIALLFHLLKVGDYERVIDKVIQFCNEKNITNYHIGIACSNDDCSGDIVVRAYQNLLEAKDFDKEVVDEF